MSSSVNPNQPREDKVRQRAYDIYQARGGREGDEVSDWLAAEREFDGSTESQGPKRARAATAWL